MTQRNGRMSSTQRGSRVLLQMLPLERSPLKGAVFSDAPDGARQGRDVVCSGRAAVQRTNAENWPHRPRGLTVVECTFVHN